MRSILRSFYSCTVLLLSAVAAQAQLTGTLTVPSAAYPTLKVAIDSLNNQGVGAGGVIVNITAGNPQTAPLGGYRLGSATLNASTSATKTIVLNGNGNNVVAQVGTSATLDGIFFIKGVDYLTINSLNLQENAANTTPLTAMEYGFALVNFKNTAPFDGCQNDAIINCSVTLNRTIATPSVGIYAAHVVDTNASALTITAVGDAHSSNKFYGNTITNVVTGIQLVGFSAASPYTLYDRKNDIGGTAAATGNTITNFGTGYTSIGGITAVNQDSLSIAYNTVNDTANGGTVSAIVGGIWGIYAFGTNSLLNVSNNTIALKGASINTGYFMYGIYSNASGTNMTASNNLINIEQPSGSASPRYGMYLPNGNNLTALSNTVTVTTAVAGANYDIYTSYVGTLNISSNTLKMVATVSGSGTHAAIYDASTATGTTISNNVFDNISINTTGSNYLIYTSNSTNSKTISGNRIQGAYTNAGTSGSFYGIYNFGSPSSSTSNVTNNRFSNINLATSGTSYGIYYGTGSSHNHVVTGDTVSNFINTGSGELRAIYVAYGLLNTITSNYVNTVTGTGTVYGLYIGNTSTVTSNISKNIVSGLSTTGSSSSLYGIYCSVTSSTTQNLFQNNVNNLSATGASATLYGMYFSSAGTTTVYNNFISDMRTPAGSGTSPIYGMYFASGTQNNIYFNTINLTPASTGTNFGATGLYYTSTASSIFDLRNNIIRVNATPAGNGTVVALRRSSGTAGVPPVNLAATTNANIYWVPAATNAFLYAEGTTTPLVNAYNITNDASFNTACANYKKFMSPRETSTFTEDNLVLIPGTATYAPAATSFAKSKAFAVTTPAITVDYNNVTRATPADIGALQFVGVATPDAAAPVITYTPLPVTTYCTTPTSFTATITDPSGVNSTAGTAPRVYYKKSTEANAFGGANNSTFNGWKWKEATLASGVYTFTIDYSLLNTPIANGDSITYFVVAQDNATIPNAGTNLGALTGTCLTSVDIAAANGPLGNAPLPNGYRIVVVPSFVATSSVTTPLCFSGSATLTVTPTALTSTIQWQQDNNTGVFADIPGATSATYTTPTLTSNNNYRAQIYCGTNVIATSNFVSVFINAPTIVSTTPATRCGYGPVTLSATGLPGNTVSWYTAATGGTAIATGNSFTTPPLNGTTTYYVSAKTVTPACENSTRVPVTATVTPPTPVVASSAQASGICLGASATITATSTNTAYNYVWSSGQTTATAVVTPTTTTKYIVTATDPTSNCTARDSVTIIVNIPVATITAAGSTNICPGGNVALNANTGSGFTYQWFVGNNPIPNATSASYIATATGSYTVQVYNPATTCTGTSAATVVTVNPFPPATITPAGSVNICSGTSVVLAGPTGTGYTYQWRNGANVATGTSTGATYSATTGGAYTLLVTANGCSSVSPVTNVTVLPLPSATMAPNVATTGCDSVILTTSDTAVTYQWNYAGSPIIGATSRRFGATVSGNYSLTNTSIANGCTATTPNVAITVNPSPPGFITYSSPLIFCEGGAVVLNTFSASNYTYQWFNNNDTIAAANGANFIATAPGTYTVRVVNTTTGCSKIATPLVVQVNARPSPVAVYDVPTNTLTTTRPFIQYQWFRDMQPIGGANQRNYRPVQNGAYSVRVIDSNGCTNMSAIVFVNSVGITHTQAGASMKIYPNPVKSVLYVKSSEPVTLNLRDVTGKTIISNSEASELNLEALNDGVYLLYVTDRSGQLIRVEKVTKLAE